jgi:hypothetical protein
MEVDVGGKSMRSQPAPAHSTRQLLRPLHHVQPGPGLQPLQMELFGGRGAAGPTRQPHTPRAPRVLPRSGAQSQVERSFPRQAPRFPRLAPAAAATPLLPGLAGPEADDFQTTASPAALYAGLHRRLGKLTGGRLRTLVLTDNRRTILSVRPIAASRRAGRAGCNGRAAAAGRQAQDAPIDLRIHRCFTIAPEAVLRAVAVFLSEPRGGAPARQALGTIREHFQRYRRWAGRTPQTADAARRIRLQPVGATLDLRELAEALNRDYFDGRLKVRITWGKSAGEASTPAHNCRRTRTASLQLGSYAYEDRLVRIHRVLDRTEVPRYVVESIVYHELLHADLPPVTRNGRRYFHTPEFRRRERQFRHFDRADRWVRQNLQRLLRARQTLRAAAGR